MATQAELDAAVAAANTAAIAKTIMDAAGDMIGSGADAAVASIASAGRVLVTNAAAPNKVKWDGRSGVDANGDLIVGSGPDTVTRLAPGADRSMLVADAQAPTCSAGPPRPCSASR